MSDARERGSVPQETSPFITEATFAAGRKVEPGLRFERLAAESPFVQLMTVASPCDALEEIDGERMFDERHRASACGIGDEALGFEDERLDADRWTGPVDEAFAPPLADAELKFEPTHFADDRDELEQVATDAAAGYEFAGLINEGETLDEGDFAQHFAGGTAEQAIGRDVNSEAELSSDDLDLEHLGVVEFQLPAGVTPPTLGFEFDLNFGFERKVTDAKGMTPPAGFDWPSDGLKVTDHEWKTSTGALQDAFVVTMDAVRMEIATAPVRIDDDVEFKTVVDKVTQFGRELIAAKKTQERSLVVPGVGGHPTTFEHPRTVVNKPEVDAAGNVKFPGDRDHASYLLARVPLVVHRVSGSYPTSTALWGAPQATLTLPLAEFGKLVWEVHKTRGGAPGEAFTGRDSDRLGLRDDLAWRALTLAVADRRKRLGTRLSDGTPVTDADFTRNVTSVLTILLMYMLTSIKKDDRDREAEAYAKGSLPLNVKTPLWQIHRFALTNREKVVLHELYTDPGRRTNLFVLASGKGHGSGATSLFPSYTHTPDVLRFLDTVPTWHTLVDALVKEQPVKVTVENRVAKKGHRKGDEILIAPLSSKLDWAKTKPRIAVEMRRLGFGAVAFAKWPGLMGRIRELAKKVNP